MEKVCILVSVLCLSASSQSVSETQRRFSFAVNTVQHLHLVAQRLFSDFETSLQTEDQRQLNKLFLQDTCVSDNVLSPIDKHETQRSSVWKLLSISYGLVQSWEFPSLALTPASVPRNQISRKLSELKIGIMELRKAHEDGSDLYSESFSADLAPFGNYYHDLGSDEPLRRTYKLLACFKKDMHKVETYLTVAKCRLYPEANCTL